LRARANYVIQGLLPFAGVMFPISLLLSRQVMLWSWRFWIFTGAIRLESEDEPFCLSTVPVRCFISYNCIIGNPWWD
jgi:hypothetical protein